MMSLVVVVLLTAYISEFFFTSGLEMRAMQTFKDGARARNLARLAFKAVQTGLLLDEVEFFTGYQELKNTLRVTAIPWEDGFLVKLDIVPQDHLFNLNEIAGLQVSKARDKVRWNLFRNLLHDEDIIPIAQDAVPAPLPEERIAELYAALFDWLDKDNVDYQGAAAVLGAEEDTYFGADPEFVIKNGKLDRLGEIRLVRGVMDSRLPWQVWEENFSVLPKKGGGLYPEKLDVNIATREEIVKFLTVRLLPDPAQLEGQAQGSQELLNDYADNAEEIAELLVPTEGLRPRHNDNSLKQALAVIDEINAKRASDFLSTSNVFFRVRIVMEVNDVQARLDALLEVERGKQAKGTQLDVLAFTLE
jgi:hypothetical protein